MSANPILSHLGEKLVGAASLDAIPRWEELQGLNNLAEEFKQLSATAIAPLGAAALVSHLNPEDASWRACLSSFCAGLRSQSSLLALKESADLLFSSKDAIRLSCPLLHSELLPGVRADRSVNPQLAAARLEVALRAVMLDSVAPFGVLDVLSDDPRDLNPIYLESLPRLIGVVLRTVLPQGGALSRPLEEVLRLMTEIPECIGDAWFELGRTTLFAALEDTDQRRMNEGISSAAQEFRAAVSADPYQDDAAALGAACCALLALFKDDLEAARAETSTLTEALNRKAAWGLRMHPVLWSADTYLLEMEWLSLVLDLRRVAQSMNESSWLDAASAVAQLGRVLEVEDSGQALGPLRQRVSIDIQQSLRGKHVLADQLIRVVASDAERGGPASSDALHKLATVLRNPVVAGEVSGSARERVRSFSPLLLELGEDAVEVMAGLPDETLVRLREQLTVSEESDFQDVVLRGILDDCVERLSSNPAFTGEARAAILVLLRHTLAFLRDRYERGGPVVLGSKLTLGLTDNGYMPVEADLQHDFYIWLQSAWRLVGRVDLEKSDVATGRVDVTVTINGLRLTTEIKRELRNASRESIGNYVPQAAQYAGAGIPFSQLLVLDLTDHSHGTSPLVDLVWVEKHRASAGASPQEVVVGLVVGNRPTPRQLSDSAGKGRSRARKKKID